MSRLEIANGGIVVGLPTNRMVGSVSSIPGVGMWIGVGYPNDQGLSIDSDEWDSFVELIQEIDKCVKELRHG